MTESSPKKINDVDLLFGSLQNALSLIKVDYNCRNYSKVVANCNYFDCILKNFYETLVEWLDCNVNERWEFESKSEDFKVVLDFYSKCKKHIKEYVKKAYQYDELIKEFEISLFYVEENVKRFFAHQPNNKNGILSKLHVLKFDKEFSIESFIHLDFLLFHLAKNNDAQFLANFYDQCHNIFCSAHYILQKFKIIERDLTANIKKLYIWSLFFQWYDTKKANTILTLLDEYKSINVCYRNFL
jgi:hypothetical protein